MAMRTFSREIVELFFEESKHTCTRAYAHTTTGVCEFVSLHVFILIIAFTMRCTGPCSWPFTRYKVCGSDCSSSTV